MKVTDEETQKMDAVHPDLGMLHPQSIVDDLLRRAESAEKERDALKKQIAEVREDIREGVALSSGETALERLAGNVVKEEFWKGALSAYRQVEAVLDAGKGEG